MHPEPFTIAPGRARKARPTGGFFLVFFGHLWEKVAIRVKAGHFVAGKAHALPESSRGNFSVQRLFCKSSQRSLDDKGRLMLPCAYRQALEEQGIASFWLTCLYGRLVACLPADWEAFMERLNGISTPSPALVRFMAKTVGLAEELTWTAQGRVRIPQTLLKEAGIVLHSGQRAEVMVVGMFSRFEIWDLERFNAIDVEDVSQELTARGIDLVL